jgi:hypothetical protein
MRVSTKIKHLLLLYTFDVSMDDDNHFTLLVTDKRNGKQEMFNGNSWSGVIEKAYKYMSKNLKIENDLYRKSQPDGSNLY